MKRIHAVIFDCDGVMFDSRQANINFYNHLLAHFNLPPLQKEDVSFVHMHTADVSIRRIFQGTPHVEDALAYRLTMNYAPFIQDMVMEPDLMTLLGKLKPSVGLAIATNRSNTIGDVLKHHGLVAFFDIVVSSLDVVKPKPHQESLLKILDFFQLGPHQAVYVGDSAVDSETAANAGMPFISYKNPDLKADFHVRGLMDILPLLGRL